MSRFSKKCLSTASSVLCFLGVIGCTISLQCVKASRICPAKPAVQNNNQTEDPLTELCRTYRECSNLTQITAWKRRAKGHILSFENNKDRLMAFGVLYNNAVDFHAGVVRQTSSNPSLEELNSPSNILGGLPGYFRLTPVDIDKINDSGEKVKFYSERKGHRRNAHDVPVISLFYREYQFKFVL